jgi:FkbM family methyltransferase
MSSSDASTIVDGQYGRFEGSAHDRVIVDEYRRLGTWAPELVALIERLFAGRAGSFIDVGANIGLVCVPVVERCGGIGIAFEPEPNNHAFLSRNVRGHGLERRIECHALACHSTTGRMTLSLSPDNLGDHRLQRTAADAVAELRPQIEVETRRLDDLLRGRELPRPIVMKVDAQGSEASVFAGARETLARVDYLVTEYSPALIVAHGDDAQAFRDCVLDFPFGAVLHVLPLPEPLYTASYVFQQLSWIADDGSDPGFFDLLFSRIQLLPPPP